MNPLAEAVTRERHERGWSIRRAVREADNIITNTWWGRFESGAQPLTDAIRVAVAAAYGWDEDWPKQLTPGGEVAPPELRDLSEAVARLAVDLAELAERVGQLESQPRSRRGSR